MDASKTKVILVCNSKFPDWGAEKKDIPNVKQNHELLRKIIVDPDFFGIPDDPQHLIEMVDASSQEILLKVKHETKSSPEKEIFERLIFYYSGHGIPGEDARLYFATSDTVRRDYEITSVDSQRLFSYLEGFCARELIVILDCCYAAQSKENNMGDADSLISKSLPEDRAELENAENGIYYLFAAGKDNVAKFNPETSSRPTYFTEALLKSISKGTVPGQALVTIGEIYNQVREEIAVLRKNIDPDIPEPRPVLQGDVSGFIFCKNIKFQNQEDLDWENLRANPSRQKWLQFRDKYPDTRFDKQMDDLISRMIKGDKALLAMKEKKDIDLAIEIKRNYKDIPYLWEDANQFMNDLAARPVEENEPQSAIFEEATQNPGSVNASPFDPEGSSAENASMVNNTKAGSLRPVFGSSARK